MVKLYVSLGRRRIMPITTHKQLELGELISASWLALGYERMHEEIGLRNECMFTISSFLVKGFQ